MAIYVTCVFEIENYLVQSDFFHSDRYLQISLWIQLKGLTVWIVRDGEHFAKLPLVNTGHEQTRFVGVLQTSTKTLDPV